MFLVAAAVLAGGTVVAFGAAGGAQSDDPPIELVSDGLPAPSDTADHRRPAVSDSGIVVAFATTPAAPDPDADAADPVAADATPAEPRVWIRDRVAGTTRPVAELGSGAPAISGNGCLVAYVVTRDAPDPVVALTTVDRCAADPSAPLPIGAVVDTVAAVGDVTAAPAVSFDGSTIVWSTGDEIRRYVRGETALVHELTDAFDADFEPTADVRTGERIDLSADGRTIAFDAGPGAAPFALDVSNVYLWSRPNEEPPTIELLSLTPSDEPGAASSGSPTISADGTLVAFESVSTDLAALGGEPATTPFVVLVDRAASTSSVVADDARLPALSADGSRLVHQQGNALRVLSIAADGAAAEDRLLIDVAPDGASAISQHGRWVVFSSAASLAVDDTDAGVDVWAADLRPSDDGDPADTTSTTDAPTTTSTVAPTTTVAPTDGSETTTTTTVASRPVFPRVTTRFPTSRRSTTFSRTSSTSLGGSFLIASATPIRFEPTIVDAGRRTATTTFTAGRSTTINSVEITSGPFAVGADTCTGLSLSAGGSCTVDVDFRPDTVGPVTGFLAFRLGDGSVTSAQLDGEGSAEPTLDLVPAVATPGQVVTVFGAGFPAGAVVELQHGIELDDVTVDDDGTFAHVFVVMPHTPAGPMELLVVGQVDRFADVTGELLVSSRNLGTGSAAFRDGIVTGLGR